MLEKCLHALPDREIQREAFRLAYYYIFAFEQPFFAVQVLSVYEAKLNYVLPDDLATGKDDSLDHICDFLVKGHPLFECPTPDERSRTTADEDEFFEVWSHSPDYLRDRRYERWLKLKSLGRSTGALIRLLPFGTGNRLLDLGRRGWYSLLKRMATAEPISTQRR